MVPPMGMMPQMFPGMVPPRPGIPGAPSVIMPRPMGGMPGMPGVVPPPGMPGMLPMLGMPPMAPMNGGRQMGEMGRMMALYHNPDQAAVTISQQQAMEWEQAKDNSMTMESEVTELAHHFNLSERHARMLDEQLKKRNNTFDDDIAAMYEILKGAKNPADLLMVSIRWMSEGVFRGTLTPNPDVEKIAGMYKLDAPSACKLAESLETRQDPDRDLKVIKTHLERSNKPSSLVMMMLKDLKAGKQVEESTKQPAIGSYLHKEETKRMQRKSRSRAGHRAKARSRSQRRDREKDDRERRDRSRSRKRSRSRRRSRSRKKSRSKSRKR